MRIMVGAGFMVSAKVALLSRSEVSAVHKDHTSERNGQILTLN